MNIIIKENNLLSNILLMFSVFAWISPVKLIEFETIETAHNIVQ